MKRFRKSRCKKEGLVIFKSFLAGPLTTESRELCMDSFIAAEAKFSIDLTARLALWHRTYSNESMQIVDANHNQVSFSI